MRKSKRAQKSTGSGNLEWRPANDIQARISYLVRALDLSWIRTEKVHCFRSKNSSARAYARIWGLNRVWQIALSEEPAYILEVLSEKYDELRARKKDEVLLHELAHIPKNFSGALMPHRRGKGGFHDKLRTMIAQYNKINKKYL